MLINIIIYGNNFQFGFIDNSCMYMTFSINLDKKILIFASMFPLLLLRATAKKP